MEETYTLNTRQPKSRPSSPRNRGFELASEIKPASGDSPHREMLFCRDGPAEIPDGDLFPAVGGRFLAGYAFRCENESPSCVEFDLGRRHAGRAVVVCSPGVVDVPVGGEDGLV